MMNCAGPSRPLFSAVRRFCSGCTRTHIPIRPYSTTLAEVKQTPAVSPPIITTTKLDTGFITDGELKTILPTMDELGLSQGDHVTVAMSGGVDSSVTLRILQNFPIVLRVLFMRNWDSLLSESDPSSSHITPTSGSSTLADLSYSGGSSKGKGKSACEWERDWEDVQRVCKFLKIPDKRVKMVDFSKEYWTRVFEPCVGVWENGGTPNPDVMCNSEIKFGALLDYVAKVHGSKTMSKPVRHYLATGHYARISHRRSLGLHRLFRAKDMTKDQSYYLSGLTVDQVERAVLPLGKITKAWTRRLARHWQLPTADREESMGVCFIGERNNFGDFITQYTTPTSESPGNLVTPSGEILGPHNGLWHYTIGQRARLPSREERWFVARKGVGESGKDVLVVPGADHPAMMCYQIDIPNLTFMNGAISKAVFQSHLLKIQIRHRMEAVPARIRMKEDGIGAICEPVVPLSSVSPGQVVAVYRNLEVLGSGVIGSTKCLDELEGEHRTRTRGDIQQYPGAVRVKLGPHGRGRGSLQPQAI